MKIAMQGKVAAIAIAGEQMEQVDETPDGVCTFLVPIEHVEVARSHGLEVVPEANPEPAAPVEPPKAPAPTAPQDGAGASESVTVTVTPPPASPTPAPAPSAPASAPQSAPSQRRNR